MLLFAALEAVSGKIERTGNNGEKYFTYDKDVMKEILGDILFNELFGPNGLRHKLDHGDYVEFVQGKDYVAEVHSKVVQYFNKKFSTKIHEDVIHPQRHFDDNCVFADMWYTKDKNLEINLVHCLNEVAKEGESEIVGYTPTNFIENY